MESGCGHGVVLRGGGPGGKKMRKRKELDALVGVKRGRAKRSSGEISPQDQLLSDSTGEEDCVKGGVHLKGRNHYHSHSSKKRKRACSALLRLSAILLTMACVVATITVMWLFIDIKEQTTNLRSHLDQVSAGNEAIPDAIQKCHSLSRQLEKNQTVIINRIQIIAQRLSNFSNMINVIQAGLSDVEKKLNDSAEFATSHTTLRSLMSSVASFGGQLNDFNITTFKVSNNQKMIYDQISGIQRNLTIINGDVEELKKSVPIKNEPSSQNKSVVYVQETTYTKIPVPTLVNNTSQNSSEAHGFVNL